MPRALPIDTRTQAGEKETAKEKEKGEEEATEKAKEGKEKRRKNMHLPAPGPSRAAPGHHPTNPRVLHPCPAVCHPTLR